jgi:hypothetical protein
LGTAVDDGWIYRVSTNTYDAMRQVISQLVEWDVVDWESGQRDGKTDFQSTTTNVYNQKGDLLQSTSEGSFYNSEDD